MLRVPCMAKRRDEVRTWAIVLAGGDGTRLGSFTEALHGRPVPKQFATVAGDRSMLQATLDRIAPLVPARRTVVVVGRAHLPWARTQLADHAATTLVQPASLGTATAMLYAASWIRLQDPDAHVLVFPSDHHVGTVPHFLDAVRTAEGVSHELGRLALIGVVPDHPDPDYGWIVAGASVKPGCWTLESFVEKPSAEAATRLRACGGLWNTFILAAPAVLLGELARTYLPDHAERFEALDRFSFAPGVAELDRVYRRLESADFSTHVLQRARDLLVVPMHDTGWSDWGTADRVLTSLHGTAAELDLRARLRRPARDAWAPTSTATAGGAEPEGKEHGDSIAAGSGSPLAPGAHARSAPATVASRNARPLINAAFVKGAP